jgi:hypothetical protein
MSHLSRFFLLTAILLAPGVSADAQTPAAPSDSALLELRTVLRAFYRNLDAHDWDALASYVLSPKLMERRGVPADSLLVLKDRTRPRLLDHGAPPPSHCPAVPAAQVDSAAIRRDGDWADVSVPRCRGEVGGVDEFRLMYFEQRWRFIYTDLF